MEEIRTPETARIQDFILNKDDITEAEEAAPKPRKKSSITYTPIIENGVDVVLERKSSRGTRIAAFIPTQSQFYIKNETGETEVMDENNLSKFLYSADAPVELKNTFWLKKLQKGKPFAQNLVAFCSNYSMLIKEGLTTFDMWLNSTGQGRYQSATLNELANLDATTIKIVKYALQKACDIFGLSTEGVFDRMSGKRGVYSKAKGFMEEEIDSIFWLKYVAMQYGLDSAKRFIDVFAESNLPIGATKFDFFDLVSTIDEEFKKLYEEARVSARGCYYRSWSDASGEAAEKYFSENNFKHNKECFEFDKMLEYMSTYRYEGFENLRNFMRDWTDELNNQIVIYRKVKDRYPKNLMTTHAQSNMKVAEIDMIHQIENFNHSYEAAKELEYIGRDYVFIVPKTPEDMVEEAFNQNNCLRIHISSVANGEERIVFMRKKSDPESSLITIEVRGDNSIGQVRGKFNRSATKNEMFAVRTWASEKNLKMR